MRTLRTPKEGLHRVPSARQRGQAGLLEHWVSLGNGVTAALGEAQPGGRGTNVGFPGGERPSPFWATSSQVSKGWDRNFRCGLSPLPAR